MHFNATKNPSLIAHNLCNFWSTTVIFFIFLFCYLHLFIHPSPVYAYQLITHTFPIWNSSSMKHFLCVPNTFFSSLTYLSRLCVCAPVLYSALLLHLGVSVLCLYICVRLKYVYGKKKYIYFLVFEYFICTMHLSYHDTWKIANMCLHVRCYILCCRFNFQNYKNNLDNKVFICIYSKRYKCV